MNKSLYKYSDITGNIIGCAMEVHSILGNGFQEKIYQKVLRYEMDKAGLHFAEEFSMPIMYKGKQLGTQRVDFLWRKKSV